MSYKAIYSYAWDLAETGVSAQAALMARYSASSAALHG